MMTLNELSKRIESARNFPANTCGASRHAEDIGAALACRVPYSMLDEEPQHCGESILATCAALYEARTEIERLRAVVIAAEGTPS